MIGLDDLDILVSYHVLVCWLSVIYLSCKYSYYLINNFVLNILHSTNSSDVLFKVVGECHWTSFVMEHICVVGCAVYLVSIDIILPSFLSCLLHKGCNSLHHYLGYVLLVYVCTLIYFVYLYPHCVILCNSFVLILWCSQNDIWLKVFYFCWMTMVYALCTCACHSLYGICAFFSAHILYYTIGT